MSTESWPEGASTATTSPTAVDAVAGTPCSPLRSPAKTLSDPGAEVTGVVRDAVVERVGARAAVDHDRREDVVARSRSRRCRAGRAGGLSRSARRRRARRCRRAPRTAMTEPGLSGIVWSPGSRGVEVRVAGEVEVSAGAQVVAHQAAVGEEPDRVRARGAVEQRGAPEEARRPRSRAWRMPATASAVSAAMSAIRFVIAGLAQSSGCGHRLRRARPRPGRRAGLAHRGGPHPGLGQRGGGGTHARHRRAASVEPFARGALAQRSNVRQHPTRTRAEDGL